MASSAVDIADDSLRVRPIMEVAIRGCVVNKGAGVLCLGTMGTRTKELKADCEPVKSLWVLLLVPLLMPLLKGV